MFWYILTLNPVDKPFAMKPTRMYRLPLHISSKPRGWSTHVASEWYWGHILSWWKLLSYPWNKQEWVAVAEMKICIPKPHLSRVVWKLNLLVLRQAIVSFTCIFIPAFVRSTSRYSLVIAFARELSFFSSDVFNWQHVQLRQLAFSHGNTWLMSETATFWGEQLMESMDLPFNKSWEKRKITVVIANMFLNY